MSHTLTEGGQITSHRLRMFRQVIKITLLGSIFCGLCIFLFLMSNQPTLAYVSLWYFCKSWFLKEFLLHIEVSKEFLLQTTKIHYHYNPTLPIDYVIKLTSPFVDQLLQESYAKFIQSIYASVASATGILGFFFYRGRLSKNQKHLSGTKIVSPSLIRLRLKLSRKASPIRIGPLPLVKHTETQHFMITGGTGTGKTNCLHLLLKQLRLNKHKAIIVDTSGVFLEQYFNEATDILLNPLHPKGSPWSPWAEGCNDFDYANLAESFIPASHLENENYWRQASKTLFISLLKKFSDTKKTSELVRWLEYENLTSLCKIVSGTKAAAHMDLSSEKTASSIRSVASTFLESLENVTDTENPFSIREWITKNDSSCLFLQCAPGQRSLLRPLLAAWIASAIRGLLSLPIDLNRRIWFIIDELPSLQRVKDIETLLTEGRKYGGCAVLSLQSPAQIENIYGHDVRKTIFGNTATKIIFKERDPEIAAQISRSFGEKEIMEIQEGISYGAHETRDSVSLSMQNKMRPVVSPTQLLELPVNTAYIKLAEGKSITKVKMPLANLKTTK